jgi:hypothetical protein
MARTYLSGDNSRGGSVTGANAKFAHLRGWHAGVEVNAGRTEDDRDCFYVNMTGGSNGYSQKRLGTVTDTPDGPRWEPVAGESFQDSSRKLSAVQEQVQEMLEAYRQGMVCGFQFCEGPEVEPETMKTCKACRALHDLLELTKRPFGFSKETE